MNWRQWLPVWSLAVVGVVCYLNSFSGVFIFDDEPHLARVARIVEQKPFFDIVKGSTRPLVMLTFGLNYLAGGWSVWGYHAVNLGIHILAACALFGIVRRTLQGGRFLECFGSNAVVLAWASALLWLVHPLHTESVTYIIQRSESMMGLCYLLSLYCLIRGLQENDRRDWFVAAVGCCAMGMLCKPVMATAPMMLILYDRIFYSRSFRELIQKRWRVYAGLASTWGILLCLLFLPHESAASSGFRLKEWSLWEYAAVQPAVVLQYLKLSFWPHPLCLDWLWLPTHSWKAVVLAAAGVAGVLAVLGWAARRSPPVGYLGLWLFVILAPSSTLIPLRDAMFEHRMYLPLAAVCVGAAAGICFLFCRFFGVDVLRRRGGKVCAVVVLLAAAGTLGFCTIRRNQDYSSAVAMWSSVVAVRPENYRAHSNLGDALSIAGRLDEAVEHYQEALRLDNKSADTHYNLAIALAQKGLGDEAIRHYTEALLITPNDPDIHNNLAMVLEAKGQQRQALSHYYRALRLRPDHAQAHVNVARALAAKGLILPAIDHCVEALRADPKMQAAQDGLRMLWMQRHGAVAGGGGMEDACARGDMTDGK